MRKDKRDILIIALIFVIVVLVGIVSYVFLIKPALNGLVVSGYNQAQVDVLNAILLQVQQTGYVQIPISENQSIILVPYQDSSQQVQEITA